MTSRDFNIPNLLTGFRVIFVPVFVYLILQPSRVCHIVALGLFAGASITDLVDGYLARKWNQETEFGKFLDPLADKFLVLGAFVTFLFVSEQIQVWMVLVIVFRDVLITCLRYLAIYQNTSLRTSRLAKVKTAFQMFSIVIILMSFLVVSVPERKLIDEAYRDAVASGLTRWEVAGSYLKAFFTGQSEGILFGLASFLPYYLMLITALITLISLGRYLITNYHLLRGPFPFFPPWSVFRKQGPEMREKGSGPAKTSSSSSRLRTPGG